MNRKFLLLVVAFILLAPAAFLAMEHWRGSRQLAATYADLRARGEVLDIQKIAPAPVPREENGIDAFLKAVSDLEMPPTLTPPGMELIAPGRAVPGSRLESWGGERGPQVTRAEFARWVEKNAPAIEALRESLQLPHRRPTLDYSQGFSLLLPHLAKMKGAVILLGALADDAAFRGDLEAALVDLRGIHAVASDLENDPLLIDQLVRIAIVAIANGRVWDILHARPWSEEQLAQLQAVVPAPALAQGMVHALEGERALVKVTLEKISAAELVDTLTQPGADEDVEGATRLTAIGRAGLSIWRFGWGDQAFAHYLRSIQALIETNRVAVREQSYAALKRFPSDPETQSHSVMAEMRTFYARRILPAVSKASVKALRGETERAMLITAIALERHRLRHGRFPATLAGLVPDFLESVPVDRMDGQPVRYRVNRDGTYTLWSTGDDGVDQGGQLVQAGNKAPSRHWWMGEDAIWPLPASDAEIRAWTKEKQEKQSKRGRSGTVTLDPEMLKRYGLLPTGPGTATNETTSGKSP